MSATDETAIDGLRHELAALRKQLASLETRVNRMEAIASRAATAPQETLAPDSRASRPATGGNVSFAGIPDSGSTGVAPPPPPAPPSPPAPPAYPAPPFHPAPPAVGQSAGWVPAPVTTTRPAAPPQVTALDSSVSTTVRDGGDDLESQMGLRWVNRIGALTLVLAALFVFKYAADNDWIGPGMRVALGLATGLGIIGLAEYLWRNSHQTVAQGIAGLGSAILYLTLFAAYGWYDLLTQLAAFGGVGLVALLTAVLALRYETQGLAILAALGAVLAPPLLSSGTMQVWPLNAYLLLVAGGSLCLAVLRGWMLQAWLVYLPVKALYWVTAFDATKDDPFSHVLVFGIGFYGLYLFAPSRVMVGLAQAAFAIALVATARIGNAPVEAWHLLVPVLAGIGVSIWRQHAVTAAAAICSVYALVLPLYLDGLEGGSDPAMAQGLAGLTGLALVWLVGAAWIPWGWLRHQGANQELASALFAVNTLGFSLAAVLHFQTNHWPNVALLLFGLGSLHFALSTLPAADTPFSRFPNLRLVTQASGAFLVAWAIPLQFGGVIVTSLWTLLAAGLAWLSRSPRRWWLDAGAYVLIVIAWFRFLLLDLSTINAQTTAFANAVFVGGVLCAVAVFSAAWAWRDSARTWTPYVFGHLFAFASLLSNLWRMSDAAAADGDAMLWRNATLSVLLSLYALGFVAAGIVLRSRANRVPGLCILLFVVAKLYVYDVWQLDTLFRIVAFGALGIVLLSTSFLYSRLRGTLRQLLQDEVQQPSTTD